MPKRLGPALLVLGIALLAAAPAAHAACADVIYQGPSDPDGAIHHGDAIGNVCLSETLAATRGQAFNGQIGTLIINGLEYGHAPDLSGTITWVAGQTTAAAFEFIPGTATLAITGTHTYSTTGTKPLGVAVVLGGLLDATGNTTGTVTVAPPDTTPPSVPVSDIVVDATSPQGASLSSYGFAAPTDAGGIKSSLCTPALPHQFAI